MNHIQKGIIALCMAPALVLAWATGAGAQSTSEIYDGIGDGMDSAAGDGATFAGTRVVPAFVVLALVFTAIAIGRKAWKKHGPEKA